MSMARTQQLRDDQLSNWKNSEFINESKSRAICARIDATFPDGRFNFLDIGSGNGRFTDRILNTYPEARATVVDNSRILLEQNNKSSRKRQLLSAVEDLRSVTDEKYDVVFLNYLLHHLIDTGRSYRVTLANQLAALEIARDMLRPGGRVSVMEHLYDGVLFHGLPGWLIYRLTSARSLEPLTRRMGANTAGVGVCFQSKRQWESMLAQAGLVIESFTDHEPLAIPGYKKALLHIGNVRGGHFWCRTG